MSERDEVVVSSEPISNALAKSNNFDRFKLKLDPKPMQVDSQSPGERTIEAQLESLDNRQRYCFDSLKGLWNDQCPGYPLSDELLLR